MSKHLADKRKPSTGARVKQFMRLARESGVHVPRDCELVGIDGNPINTWLAPWLTSVEIPHRDFGPRVVDLMVRLWGGEPPREHLMPHRMVVALEA